MHDFKRWCKAPLYPEPTLLLYIYLLLEFWEGRLVPDSCGFSSPWILKSIIARNEVIIIFASPQVLEIIRRKCIFMYALKILNACDVCAMCYIV